MLKSFWKLFRVLGCHHVPIVLRSLWSVTQCCMSHSYPLVFPNLPHWMCFNLLQLRFLFLVVSSLPCLMSSLSLPPMTMFHVLQLQLSYLAQFSVKLSILSILRGLTLKLQSLYQVMLIFQSSLLQQQLFLHDLPYLLCQTSVS